MIRSYVFKLQMSARIGRSFEAAMQISNDLYNAALEERIGAWSKQRISISKFDQTKSLTIIRREDKRFSCYAVTMLRAPLAQVDEAFKGFFSRMRKNKTPGFPRFRSIKRVKSFAFTESAGWKLTNNRLTMKGLPAVRLKMHRDLSGNPLALTIKKRNSGWIAIVMVKLPDVYGPVKAGVAGYDLGVSDIITDCSGKAYGEINPERSSSRQRLKIEHDLARQKRGSRRWEKTQRRLARHRHREACRRRTQHFQKASEIISTAPGILVLEKLTVKNMTRSAKGTIESPGTNVRAKAGLNRSLQDSGISQFTKILTDKAESAGRLVILVNPHGTSQQCSGCSSKVSKTLNERRHHCGNCGLNLARDHNAAINIRNRGVVAPERNGLSLAR